MGRNQSRLDQTLREIKEQTNNTNLSTFLADFSSLAEVRKLSDAIHQKFTHLDVLINNAGVFMDTRQESVDGHEMTFAINVLAPFLLTSLLLDLLKKGSASRIVNVSSISQASRIDFDNLQLKKSYGNGHKAYELSKLSNIMFTYEMAAMLKNSGKDSGITVNCLDPGTVNTKMLLQGWGPCGIDISDANNEFHLVTDAKFNNVTGKYFVDCRERRSSSISYDKEARKRLWDILITMTDAKFEA
ncbi:retinol dehydrogenase 14-like [Amphiura filiformis]|uniref:retinol dehydrogenase 14-like n=1 Tax=Amphiura filiformis TaxID=82378 RepID=UPI003B210B12